MLFVEINFIITMHGPQLLVLAILIISYAKNQQYDVSGSMFDSFTIPALGPTLDSSLKE